MRIRKKFDFYSDPSHGWLKVPMSIIDALGIGEKITPYSYRRGDDAYLEEDCDATTFVSAFKGKYGTEPSFRFHHSDKHSRIRSFRNFWR